ncbi:MAG: hypothetical protein JXA71_12195 [Chitinispirillaceae bacterium]|nr:hypothetical protein [Chitinispirillaceae bacterium]
MELYGVLLFDEFPAQVAAAYDPKLRAAPYVVVRQSGESHKSVAWSVSGAARARGVHAGMALHVIRRDYGDVHIVPYCGELHEALRVELARVLLSYTPDVKVLRTGACRLDLSSTPFSRGGCSARQVAALQCTVASATGLARPAIGIAESRLAARIAARRALPCGSVICPAGGAAAMLARCETSVLPGLSAACRVRLRRYGLRYVSQVQTLPRRDLIGRFGPEGERLFALAHGINVAEAAPAAAPLQVETVLARDTGDRSLMLQYLRRTVDRFCHRLRVTGMTVHAARIMVRYTDNRRVQKTVGFGRGIAEYLPLVTAMTDAFDAVCVRRVGIKSILIAGTRCEALTGQQELFKSAWEEKQRNLGAKIAAVRQRLDFDTVFSGSDHAVHALSRGSIEGRSV